MRIAFFSHLDMNLYLFRLSWMTALRAAGHEVDAVAPRGDYLDRFAAHGVRAVPFPMDRGSLDPLVVLGASRRLRRLLAAGRYDAVDTFTLQGSIVGAPAATRAGVPEVICHITGLGYLFTEAGARVRLLRAAARRAARRALRSARWVTFQNEDDAEELAGCVPREKRVLIRGTGVDTAWFSASAADADRVREIRDEAGVGPTSRVVTFVGRFLTHKGLAELVEAARALEARRPGLVLLLVGWRDQGNPAVVSEEFLLRAAATPCVRLLGRREDVREILALTDVFALPSYREGTPRTVLEAMAMGKPVVATDVPGCRQAVEDGVTGLLVPRADARALESALDRLLGDASLRAAMGAAGRRRVEREFSTERVVRQVLGLHGVAPPPGMAPGSG